MTIKTCRNEGVDRMRMAWVGLAAFVVALALAPSALALTHSNTSAIPVSDSATPPTASSLYPSQITVAGETGAITDVDVTLSGFSDSFPDDVDVLLVGPTGQAVILMSDAGGADPVAGLNLTFSDGGATLPTEDEFMFVSGTYAPGNFGPSDPLICATEANPDSFPAPAPAGSYGSTLSSFTGLAPNGTWSLYVVDDCSGDAGQIAGGWSLTISTGPTAALLRSFAAKRTAKTSALLSWRTASELDLVGFHVYRVEGTRLKRVNRTLVPARGRAGSYQLRDRSLRAGRAYRYRLQALTRAGEPRWLASASLAARPR